MCAHVQVGMALAFMHYISEVLHNHAEDLNAYEDDDEV